MSIHYDPKEETNIYHLLDVTEYTKLVDDINASNLSNTQKHFLKLAASRFIRLKYEKIADYYSSTIPEMREWIERLHLVVVDYDNAIKNGYFKFQEDYKKLLEEIIGE